MHKVIKAILAADRLHSSRTPHHESDTCLIKCECTVYIYIYIYIGHIAGIKLPDII